MRNKLLSLVLLSLTNLGIAQTQFWSDDFEDAGSPSSGTRTPSSTFYASTERYFNRVTTAQINWTTAISGVVGSKFWGGADIDNITGQNTQSHHQNVTWSSINISGKTGLSFSGLFAIGNLTSFDHFPGSSPIDYMMVEYRIDGGAWTSVVRFFPNLANSGSGSLALETTGDSLAQGEGAALSGTFTQFSGNIVGTGTLLDLRFKCEANGTTFEEVGGDNFRLFYTTALPVTISSFTASCEGETEVISWVSESENLFDHYELESSTDLEQFESVATIPAIGESSESHRYRYVINDKTDASLSYYRLKMVDLDGTVNMLSPISGNQCAISGMSELLNSYLYQDQKLILLLNEQNLSVELLTITGQSIFKSTQISAQNELTIPILYSSQNIFLLRISNQDQTKTVIHRLFLW